MFQFWTVSSTVSSLHGYDRVIAAAFLHRNPRIPCQNIPRMDLSKFLSTVRTSIMISCSVISVHWRNSLVMSLSYLLTAAWPGKIDGQTGSFRESYTSFLLLKSYLSIRIQIPLVFGLSFRNWTSAWCQRAQRNKEPLSLSWEVTVAEDFLCTFLALLSSFVSPFLLVLPMWTLLEVSFVQLPCRLYFLYKIKCIHSWVRAFRLPKYVMLLNSLLARQMHQVFLYCKSSHYIFMPTSFFCHAHNKVLLRYIDNHVAELIQYVSGTRRSATTEQLHLT